MSGPGEYLLDKLNEEQKSAIEYVIRHWDEFNKFRPTPEQGKVINDALTERPLPRDMHASPCGEIHIAKMEYPNPYKYCTITINGKEFLVKKDIWYPLKSLVYLVFPAYAWNDTESIYTEQAVQVSGYRHRYGVFTEYKFSDGDSIEIVEYLN